MKYSMPCSLDLLGSLDLTLELEELANDSEYVFDHASLSTVEPFGMLLAGAKIREFVENHEEANHADVNFKQHTYAGHMGFFQSILQDFGKKPGEAFGSSRYIPITEILVEDMKKETGGSSELRIKKIEREAYRLAVVLSQRNDDLCEYLTYSIRELIRNIVEHSKAVSIWIAGQYWPTKNLVEISILDQGLGIQSTLSRNPKLKIRNDRDALFLCIEPGITRKGHLKIDPYDEWANTGYGLYMTSSICQRGGDFAICSGDSCLYLNEKINNMYSAAFSGTAIRMRINTRRISKLTQDLKMLLLEGERLARHNSKQAVLSASKISRILANQSE
ncbi:MAG: hypothetical protein HZC44_10260 [Geobacter sp.]|nr:hypothetical protein [Geobacter sp.]